MAASLHQDLLGLHDKGPAVAHRDCSAYWRHNEVLRHEEAPVIGRDVLDAADDVGEDILLPVVVEAVDRRQLVEEMRLEPKVARLPWDGLGLVVEDLYLLAEDHHGLLLAGDFDLGSHHDRRRLAHRLRPVAGLVDCIAPFLIRL